MRRTKIVATIGPASRERKVLESLCRAGVDVVRLNFSHGEHHEHLAVMESVREISAALRRPIALLQDLSGPKIRTGRLKDGGPVELRTGGRITITIDETIGGTSELISTTYDPLPQDVSPGDRILLDDGNLELKVIQASLKEVECEVVHGGWLKPNKGMNLPGVKLSTPALTEKDRRDLAFGVRNGVDYVALSFVRQAADVEECKALVHSLGGNCPVIAKIEKREAVDDLPSILEVTDGVMVARGDLGVELSTEEVPTLQKRIIEMANGAGKVVITATQMLESMVENPRPTRAEASDVANAILDGTDGIMLSAETAAGRYPVESVATMARIALYTEEHYGAFRPPARVTMGSASIVARSLARVASTVAEELDCKLIVAFTESGTTAKLVSTYRPRARIAAITPNAETHRQLALWWGVVPVRSEYAENTDEMIVKGELLLREQALAAKGDTVLMLAGQSHTKGATNMLRVHTIS
ncbi:MAG TPA: pyruvate kinase [Vicinamibacteria bacterium]|nr:pyruvate kinase [Vicinamibacteria bacterium]